MRRVLLLLVFVPLATLFLTAVEPGRYQQGTVARMRMAHCLVTHSALVRLSGGPAQELPDICPEYTLVSDRVVYLVVGKRADQLMPLAEGIDFRLYKNELAVRVDDVKRETRFTVKEMVLREDWERDERRRNKEKEIVPPGQRQAGDTLARAD